MGWYDDMVKKKEEKQYPLKNYIYAVLILIGGILLTLGLFKLYNIKKEEKLSNSYLLSSNTINISIDDLDTLDQIVLEAPSSYFVYISYTGSEQIYRLEKELKKIIDKYKINDIFYYVNVNNYENNKEYLDKIKIAFGVEKLDKIPAIVYIDENDSSKNSIIYGKNEELLNANELESLLNNNGFTIIK
jgi:DNA integrity scanning protein DisA with diadenylate cyclase activity